LISIAKMYIFIFILEIFLIINIFNKNEKQTHKKTIRRII